MAIFYVYLEPTEDRNWRAFCPHPDMRQCDYTGPTQETAVEGVRMMIERELAEQRAAQGEPPLTEEIEIVVV